MADRGGILARGEGLGGVCWDLLGQLYLPKVDSESCFAFETVLGPGQFVQVHLHTDQEECLLMLEGQLRVKHGGVWDTVYPGDLVRTPRGMPLGYFNDSDTAARALVWVAPAGPIRQLFEAHDTVMDVDHVEADSARFGLIFLPAEDNE